MVPAAARSASSCTRRIASPARGAAGAASAIGRPSSRSVSGPDQIGLRGAPLHDQHRRSDLDGLADRDADPLARA